MSKDAMFVFDESCLLKYAFLLKEQHPEWPHERIAKAALGGFFKNRDGERYEPQIVAALEEKYGV